MRRNKQIYLLGILLLFIAFVAINYFSPKPVDWNETYNTDGKDPYDCYILNDMLPMIFPQQKIEYNDDTFYLSLDSNAVEKKNIIIITNLFSTDKLDLDALLKFVARGNDLFISSSGFSSQFLEQCKIKIEYPVVDTAAIYNRKESLFLLAPELKNDSGYHYNRSMPLSYITSYDTLKSQRLGVNRLGKTNFMVTKHGLGNIYVHTQPLVFTNYHLLYGNASYASKVLSYLPVRMSVWDNYYKPEHFVNGSPMRYILSQAPLQSAYYLLLITLLLYLLVESRRRQRVIPIMKPLENRSLQFVKTIGSLYFKQGNNIDMARKKSIFFKEFLRERYFIIDISATDNCAETISVKSGVEVNLVRQLLYSIDHYDKSLQITDQQLIELNQKMEMFYKQCL